MEKTRSRFLYGWMLLQVIWCPFRSRVFSLKKVLVKFISIYAEKLGKERVFELRDDATIEDLVDLISRELETAGVKVKPVVFVNYRFVREGQLLNDGDEVLIMPPFAGGGSRTAL